MINNFNIAGVVLSLELQTSGAGKEYGKLTVSVERVYGEKVYSDNIECLVFGNSVETVKGLQKGQMVGVTGRVSSKEREYQGQIKRDLSLFVDSINPGPKTAQDASYDDDDIPF